jgi:IclR family pca regulon transcriptional regulator
MALPKPTTRRVTDELTKADKSLSSFTGNPNFVLSLARGLKVFEAFDTHNEGLSIADVSRQTGFSRAATRRLLLSLEMPEYTEGKGRTFRLKAPVLKLGFSYLSSSSLPAIAQPVLEHLTGILQESTSLSVLGGVDIVYLFRAIRD